MREAGDRVVIGPASDSGYYLVGLKKAHRFLFDDISWSTSEVTQRTLDKAYEARLDATLVPEWYDVDDAMTYLTAGPSLCRV